MLLEWSISRICSLQCYRSYKFYLWLIKFYILVFFRRHPLCHVLSFHYTDNCPFWVKNEIASGFYAISEIWKNLILFPIWQWCNWNILCLDNKLIAGKNINQAPSHNTAVDNKMNISWPHRNFRKGVRLLGVFPATSPQTTELWPVSYWE